MMKNLYFTITNKDGQVITHAKDLQEAVDYIRRETTPKNPMKLHFMMEYFETLTIY